MGKLKVFDILLDNHVGVYFASQHLTGRVIVELDAPMKMREIRLTFKGEAYVHWTESHSTGSGKNRHTTTRHYSASETYFHQKVPLYGLGMGTGQDNTLPQGSHAFPFSFILPPSLPSSFEGSWGHVRYTVKATIDKPWKFDHDVKRPFTVIALLDLNLQPNAMSATQNQATKMLCCLCCKSGPINGMFRIERMGYVPGESIPFYAEIQNLSRAVCDVDVRLNMTTVFHATSKSRSETKEVARVVYNEVAPGDSASWTGAKLVIPPLPPSFLVGCSIIDIRYYLELIIDPSGPAFKLHVPVEVMLGTVPLRSVVQQYQQQQHQQPMGFQPPSQTQYGSPGGATAAPVPSAPDLPPPSYSDCVLGTVNIKDDEDNEYTRGDMNYTPKYTYYDWSK